MTGGRWANYVSADTLLEAVQANTAATVQPKAVYGIGTRAGRLPEWLVALRGRTVLAVTVTHTESGDPPDPSVLEHLAAAAARRLGWH
jgi:hypothetical protein